MENWITYKGAVYPWHCDHMGHMNVMWYVGKFDEATWHVFTELGLTPQFLRENNRGMAAVEQHIEYKRELLAGDIVTVTSRIVEVKEKVLRFSHEMFNAQTGELSARTDLTGVYLDKSIRRATALPLEIRERALALIKPLA